MNQTFLSFTFKSNAPAFLLLETEQGAEITIEDGQAIAFDQIDDVIEALKAIKASGAKKQGNGAKINEGESKEINAPAIPDGSILPPFNFDTPEKLRALVGRAVRLRDGSVCVVKSVDTAYDCLTGAEEAIFLDNGIWLYNNGLYRAYWHGVTETDFDVVEVLVK